ncbi:hypothetical protein BCR32DRAFT_329505 [Anaeromyces robustus]|uniref:Acyltransferase 3 domain-containing protein n=1 Tax=Anaeromyces robustus TaxID=1754192 RepID=A0A1Y1WS69_9FUNG|nr:hypothetical protein BCR32DRAFT_329505 [Anaeromyces robustus]|eukprot:ORX76138.1 hypothetical protein BCR32DRAFT_329505 [Anaeromyces robustus]
MNSGKFQVLDEEINYDSQELNEHSINSANININNEDEANIIDTEYDQNNVDESINLRLINDKYDDEIGLSTDAETLQQAESLLPTHNNPPVKKSKRVYWADCARIFSMVAIILLHSSSFDCELRLKLKNDSSWIIICCFNCLTRFGVPMFVLLSGTFILDPSRNFSFKKLFKHNILRLATAFAFWSTVNAVLDIYLQKESPPLLSDEYMIQFFKKFFVGEEYLWFIFMIIGCYLIAPILRLFSDNVLLARYFLGLCVFFGSFIPTLNNFFAAYRYTEAKNELTVWTSRWHYHFTLEFVGYFVGGYHIMKYVNIRSYLIRFSLYLLCIIDVLVLTCLTIHVESPADFKGYSHHFRGTDTLTIAIYSVILFIFFQHEIGRITLTFGMYLSHMVIKNILVNFLHISQYEFLGMALHPVIGVPLLWIIITILSLLTSYGISLIPVLNKYII